MSRCGERGSATIAVSMFGALAVVIASSIAVRFVHEFRAIDDSLAEVRSYWAAFGHDNYALSRTAFGGSCPGKFSCPNATKRSANAQAYLDEIIALRTWTYPDVGPSYQITLTPTAAPDPTPIGDPARSLIITTIFCAAPTDCANPPEALRILRKKQLRPIELRYCVDIPAADAPCKTYDSMIPETGWHHVTSIHRPKS